ncbi:zinc/iron permease [Tieghemostelium lacteum]|uniref:Zinc/iron permease n=1 Tax=Tieghemostelium lacteum TaxID=361077 RepID=A0A151Z8P1_TIELA|nr:zinc/iron permease [Tieghemostelium lacteum]|eukprot:KYQ90297.1 zinc/iron permease [Tieghemostelium lacteum]
MTDISKHFTGEASEEHTEEDSFTKKLVSAKAGLIVGIFFLTLLSSYIPWIVGRARTKSFIFIIPLLTCVSAGVIIGGGFAHVLPGAQGYFESYLATQPNASDYAKNFPWAQSIAIFVMFILIAIDKILVEKGISGEQGHNHMNLSEHSQEFHNHPAQHTGEVKLKEMKDDEESIVGGDDVTPDGETYQAKKEEKHSHGHGHGKKKEKHHPDDGHGHHSHTQGNGKSQQSNASQAWIFFVALSVHSILDGLGLGAETEEAGFYGLLVAVLAHKFLDGFALGVPMYYSGFPFLQSTISLVFCAAMTPLGIGIGMAISESYGSASGELAQAIVLSVTCGSFFYISLIELLPSGLCQPGWLKLKLVLAFLGWAVMTILALWV